MRRLPSCSSREASGPQNCRSTADIRTASGVAGTIAAILHMEGAEAIDLDLVMLDEVGDIDLRSLGPVWSRPAISGIAPRSFQPGYGLGLTDAGRRLVKRCDELGILIDLSHMNEAGFWDIAKLSTAPLIATHSMPMRFAGMRAT